VNSHIPGAKHICLLKSDNSVQVCTPAVGYLGLGVVIKWIRLQMWTGVVIDVDV